MSKAKLQAVIDMMKNNPNVRAATITRKLGIKKTYTYVLMSGARRALAAQIPVNTAVIKPEAVAAEVVDMVNRPPHYTQGGIETIDFIEAKQLGYNLGNVVKYITRSAHKGARRQDLEKALWYLKREITSLSK